MGNWLLVSIFAQPSNFQERITDGKLKVAVFKCFIYFVYHSNVEYESHVCILLTLLYAQRADCMFATRQCTWRVCRMLMALVPCRSHCSSYCYNYGYQWYHISVALHQETKNFGWPTASLLAYLQNVPHQLSNWSVQTDGWRTDVTTPLYVLFSLKLCKEGWTVILLFVLCGAETRSHTVRRNVSCRYWIQSVPKNSLASRVWGWSENLVYRSWGTWWPM